LFFRKYTIFNLTFYIILFLLNNNLNAKYYKFAGGPSGGTFQYYASAIATLAKKHKIRVLASASAGSIDNIKKIEDGEVDFAVAYSGHVFQGKNGILKNEKNKYNNIFALGFFYGAPAQLVVKAESNIKSAKQLAGKSIGVGNEGSGAAANSELFFSELGIWKTVNKRYLGYRKAAESFRKGDIDAFWLFTGFPNAAVIEAALQNNIELVNIFNDAQDVNMFKKYPYFSKVVIPAYIYKGVDYDTVTFQDSALWIVGKDVKEDIVYELLKIVYSDNGYKYMVSVHKSAKNMTIKNGTCGIVTPLHTGAVKFWKEKGIIN